MAKSEQSDYLKSVNASPLLGKVGLYRSIKPINDEVPEGAVGLFNGYDIWTTLRSHIVKEHSLPQGAIPQYSVDPLVMESDFVKDDGDLKAFKKKLTSQRNGKDV